jgi:hypothetical protein
MWPTVREAARRILRLHGMTVRCPQRFATKIDQLILEMGDAQPSRLDFPATLVHDLEWIDFSLASPVEGLSEHVVRVGGLEPGANTCWLPWNIDVAWSTVLDACKELLAAGYPGCVGCGGPNSELPWDERKSREIWVLQPTKNSE